MVHLPTRHGGIEQVMGMFLLQSDLEQQLACVGIGITFHQSMRQSGLLQWKFIDDRNIDLACQKKIHGLPCSRDQMSGIVFSEIAETITQYALIASEKHSWRGWDIRVAAGVPEMDHPPEGSQQAQALAARWLPSSIKNDIDASPCGHRTRRLDKTLA